MLDLETVPRRYEDAIALLANWHRSPDDASFAVYSFPDPEGAVVRLIEVSDRFPTVEEVQPVKFGQSADFPFPSTVAQLSPRNWDQIEAGRLLLPDGWHLEDRQRVTV